MEKIFKTTKEIMPEVYEDIDNAYHNNFPHINKTYYTNLDSIVAGFNNGELITIAGERNNCCNLFMLQIAQNCMLKGGKHVLVLDIGDAYKYTELLNIIKISNTSKYYKLSLYESLDSIYEKMQDFIKIYPNSMIFINGLEQIFNDMQLRFETRDKIEPLSINLKRFAREYDIPVILCLNLSQYQKNYASTNINIHNLGIYDAFTCHSDKILVTKLFGNDMQKTRKELDLSIIKNKNGKTGTIYFSLYPECQDIVEYNYYADEQKTSIGLL